MNTRVSYGLDDGIATITLDDDKREAAHRVALAFAKLNGAAHTGTKMRIREQLLRNIRTAIEADRAVFRGMYGLA